MKNMEMIEKYAVLHCVYQLIASADGSVDEERDEEAIELALTEVGLNSIHSWDMALRQNPYDCFAHVAALNNENKAHFRMLLFQIASMGGNVLRRMTCARHLFQLCRVSEDNMDI